MEEKEENNKRIFIVEIEGESLDSIEEIVGFVGRRVFNYEDGGHIKLSIE